MTKTVLRVAVKKRLGAEARAPFVLDVRLTISAPITVLVGASGAGKSTLLKLLAGIVEPDEGLIELNDRAYFDSTRGINLPIQDRAVGFVFQDYALFPHLTAERNIAYGVKLKDKGARLTKAREMLRLFHIEATAGRIPSELSGGEQQRVALARALASDPSIVLLDEPLSAVDVEMRLRLLDEIEAAQRATNVPFIYVTHNLEEAKRLGTSRRIVLHQGRVVEEQS